MKIKPIIGVFMLAMGCLDEPQHVQKMSLTQVFQKAAKNLDNTDMAIHYAPEYAWNLFLYALSPFQDIEPSNANLTWNAYLTHSFIKSSQLFFPNETAPVWPVQPKKALVNLNEPVEIIIQSDSSAGIHDTHGIPLYYTIAFNGSSARYIVDNFLYSTKNLLTQFEKKTPITFPNDAIAFKASWKRLYAEDDKSHYYTIQGNIQIEGQPKETVLLGLTGLHISSGIIPHWFFTTFEHIENPVKTSGGASPSIPTKFVAANSNKQEQLKGTFLAYYRCNGAEVGNYRTVQGVPSRLGNTQIETQFMETSSCIGCHSYAGLGKTPSKQIAFTYFPRSGIDPHTNLPMGLLGEVNPSDIYSSYQPSLRPSPASAFYAGTDMIWSVITQTLPAKEDQLVDICISNWVGSSEDVCQSLQAIDQ